MKTIASIFTGILLCASLVSCSKISSNSAACSEAGFYGDQSECQNSVSLGTCVTTTVQAANNNLVCWKSSTASTTSNQGGNTNTNTNTGCSADQGSWIVGAWSPANCGTNVTARNRTVTCDQTCGCSAAKPSTISSCTPDLYMEKHYESECTSAGGTVVMVEGNSVCKMVGASCASGWTQLYLGNIKYTLTSPGNAYEHSNCHGGRSLVTTGHHDAFSPARVVESRLYCSNRHCLLGCRTWSRVYANVYQVACY